MKNHFDDRIYKMAGRERMPVPEELSIRVDNIIRSQEGARSQESVKEQRRRHFSLPGVVIPAATLVLVFSVTVSAAVSMYQRRMEEMNQEKLEEYFAQIYAAAIPADTYNRSMTDEEQERLAKLENAYRNEGLFPEETIRLLDSRDAYKGKGIGYYAATGTFYLPEGELSDEELLQLIDFRCKRDYSLRQVNSMIESGEADAAEILGNVKSRNEVAVPVFTEQETIIPYQGSLSITTAAAGHDCIYLAGHNEIHKMGIEESASGVFYNGFAADTWVRYMVQAQDGLLYAGVSERQENGSYAAGILVIDEDGNLVRKIDLSKYYENPEAESYIFRMAVDDKGYIYLQGVNIGVSSELMVLDSEGDQVSVVDPNAAVEPEDERMAIDPRDGICTGRDGKVYIWFTQGDKKGIASVNPDSGSFEDIHYIDYDGAFDDMDVIGIGNDSDFILWGYDGMYTWSMGDEKAERVYQSYEKDYRLEGALACATEDGRILVVDCTEVKETDPAGGQAYLRMPEKTVFYYEADAVKQ